MKVLLKITSYLAAFDLGLYVATQFKFHQPIELHRWVITSLFFVVMVYFSNKK